MRTLRFIGILWLLAVLACVAAAVTGCAGMGGLVTARVRIQSGTNVVEIRQPKDTTIDSLTFDPVRGVLRLEGYASAANAEAIAAARAQAEAQERLFRRALELGGQLGATAARAYGIPIPAAGIAPSNSPAVPEGWKLVPKDDPSKPQLELTHE